MANKKKHFSQTKRNWDQLKKVSNAAEHLILQNDGFEVVAVVVKRSGDIKA